MASWQSLPNELRLLIWEIVVHKSESEQRAHKIQLGATGLPNSLAACAAVSCEWQGLFERITFKRLVIGKHEVDQFAAAVEGARKVRLGYVRHLRLHVCLSDYDSSQCYQKETVTEKKRNNAILAKALWPLLDILATWDPQLGGRDSEEHGMVLELSAVSQSDAQHMFRDFRLKQTYPYETLDDLDINFAGYKKQAAADLESLHGHCRRSSWMMSMPPTQGAKSRLRGWPLNTTRRVPRLDIVQGFMIRRRFYRLFSSRLILSLLACGLQNIRELRIEQWTSPTLYRLSLGLGRERLPESLRELHIFLNIGHAFNLCLYYTVFQQPTDHQGTALATASRFLESVMLSYLVHATDFFNGMEGVHLSLRQGACLWPRLRTLALTDRSLSPDKDGHNVLELAGRMALEMPLLKIMELWNVDGINGCFFRFEATSPARVTIKGTWDTRPMWIASCRRAWAVVANRFSVLPLHVSIDMLPNDGSHLEGSACAVLRFMKLRNKILDPVSRYQMEWELICLKAFCQTYTTNRQWEL